MDKKTFVLFDNISSATAKNFNNNWKVDSDVEVLTASKENIAYIEKLDTGSTAVYIGDQKENQERVEINQGIHFSSATFNKLTNVIATASFTSNLGQNIDENNKKESSVITRINANKIKRLSTSIVAIGFHPSPQQITIIGSAFSISNDGRILAAAHLYNQLNDEQRKNLKANVMIQQLEKDLEQYKWLPINLVKKDDKNDLAIFQLEDYKNTLLEKLEFGDSEKVEIGQEVYFIGFPYAAQLMNEGFGITLVVNRAIISNIKRDGIDPAHPRNWLIVDAISNPGNSGCPLIDEKTNKVIGVMTIAFRTKSQTQPNLDIREPMHIAGAKPINLAKDLL